MTDPQFLDQLRNGEEAAFYRLVDDWKNRIYNTALGLVQQAEDAEDITQEVFITAWKSIRTFRGESGIQTWLYKIAVHQSLDCLRIHPSIKHRVGQLSSFFGVKRL